MRVPFAPRVHSRSGTPALPLKNFWLEPGTESAEGHLRPRPNLGESAEYGSGPVYATTTHLGKRYTVSGTTVYENGTSLGSVASGGYVQFAQSESQLVVTSGGNAYLIEEGVLTQITDDSLPQVSGVFWIGGVFYYPNLGSSQYHFSEVGQAGVIDDLGFANAESDPDQIVRGERVGDLIALLGSRTIEWMAQSGDAESPLTRSGGRSQDKGCLAFYSVVKADNALFFVGNEGGQGRFVLRTGGNTPEIISDLTVNTKLAACENIEAATAFSAIIDGETFYVLNIPGQGSYGLNLRTKLWSEWASIDRETFRVRCAGDGLFGDDETGQLYTFGSGYTDEGAQIIREASCWLPVTHPGVLGALSLVGATGVGLATGQGSDPLVEMRWSNGGLLDFTNWRTASIGASGSTVKTTWRQLGMMTSPGRLLHFRWSDPVLSVPYYVLANEYP